MTWLKLNRTIRATTRTVHFHQRMAVGGSKRNRHVISSLQTPVTGKCHVFISFRLPDCSPSSSYFTSHCSYTGQDNILDKSSPCFSILPFPFTDCGFALFSDCFKMVPYSEGTVAKVYFTHTVHQEWW